MTVKRSERKRCVDEEDLWQVGQTRYTESGSAALHTTGKLALLELHLTTSWSTGQWHAERSRTAWRGLLGCASRRWRLQVQIGAHPLRLLIPTWSDLDRASCSAWCRCTVHITCITDLCWLCFWSRVLDVKRNISCTRFTPPDFRFTSVLFVFIFWFPLPRDSST